MQLAIMRAGSILALHSRVPSSRTNGALATEIRGLDAPLCWLRHSPCAADANSSPLWSQTLQVHIHPCELSYVQLGYTSSERFRTRARSHNHCLSVALHTVHSPGHPILLVWPDWTASARRPGTV